MNTTIIEQHFQKRGSGCEFEMEIDWLRRYLPAGTGPVLDLGCGNGALFDIIGQQRVVGLDYSWEGLAYTAARCPHSPILCASAEYLPFADDSFDAITAQHLIEHLPDYKRALDDWYRVLKPGGVLLVLTPNRLFRNPSVYDDPTHVHIFDHLEMARFVRDCGFTVLDIRTLGIHWMRDYHGIPGGWRLRNLVTGYATSLASVPTLRWQGQTLCCAARKP